MSLTRRYSAAMLAASALILGACGSETPVQPTPEIGESNDNPRNIFAENTSFFFTDAGGSLTGPQQLKIGGLVAIGSYVLFDNWVFTPAGHNWLRISPTPMFQREPLRWVFNIWVDPSTYAAMDNGVYTAHAHASVPAALNGPIGIAKAAGSVTQQAVAANPDPAWMARNLALTFLSFAAIVSIGIGIVNLLPIPVLDGGHLLFYGYEAVARRPLSARVQEAGYRLGLVLLVGLMLFVTWNDLQKLSLFKFLGGPA